MKKTLQTILLSCLIAIGLISQVALAQENSETTGEAELTAEEQAYVDEANAFLEQLTPQHGEIKLASAGVTLNLPDSYYFLGAADSRKVLEDAWGNPPDTSILGMIFETDSHAYYNDYAVAITFEKSGYVSDEDAKEIDFAEMMKDMKKGEKASNKARIEQGYDPMYLLGWAETPVYDSANKRLYWAKKLKFGESESNTLNYNLRFLGRKGVLEFNYVADETALDTIKTAMPSMIEMASFNPGHKYSDFNATTDKIATYGVAGLIGGGLLAKKAGLLGILLLFLKKGWILILAAGAFGKRFIGGLFGKKENDTIG